MLACAVLSVCVWGAPGPPFVDSSREELIQAAPELSGLGFESGQGALDPLLTSIGDQAGSMLQQFRDVSMAEAVHEMRFDSAHLQWKEHRDRFRYVIAARPFAESRKQTQNAVPPNAKSGFLIAGPFEEMRGYWAAAQE